jgi:hypothetical protein
MALEEISEESEEIDKCWTLFTGFQDPLKSPCEPFFP